MKFHPTLTILLKLPSKKRGSFIATVQSSRAVTKEASEQRLGEWINTRDVVGLGTIVLGALYTDNIIKKGNFIRR